MPKQKKIKKHEETLNTFKDRKGRKWTFRVTAKHAMGLHDDMDFDVRSIENLETLADLAGGDMELLRLMAYVLQGQLESRGVTADELFDDMDGDDIQSAGWAFVHGLIFFLPSHTRNPLLAWASRVKTIQNQSGSAIASRINSDEMTDEIEKMISNLMDMKS